MNYGENDRKYGWKYQHGLGESLLPELPQHSTILDLGCGMGEFADMLAMHGCDVVRVDGADHCVEYVRANGHDCIQLDLENSVLPFDDDSFDLVVSLDVIEHLWNTDHYLSEICRVTKPGGEVILSTPNYNCVWYRFLSLIGKFENYGTHDRHKKLYTLRSFVRTVSPFFRVDEIKATPIAIFKSHTISRWMNLVGSQIGIRLQKRRGGT